MFGRPNFPGRLRNEKIYIFQRRHWFTLIRWLTVPGLLWIGALLTAWLISEAALARILPISDRGIALVWVVLLLPTSSWAFWTYLDWRNDLYIVTDQRAIHVEKIYFLFERRDETYLDKIQDVLVVFPNAAANLLGFGNVEIQTAGTTGKIIFEGISQSRAVQKMTFELIDSAKRRRRGATRDEAELDSIRDLLGLPASQATQPQEQLPRRSRRTRRRRFADIVRRAFRPAEVQGKDYHVWRKHWWILVKHLAGPVLVLALLTIGWISSHMLLGSNYPPPLDLILAPLLGAILVWIAWQVIDWQNDLYIVTPDRVIDIEKIPIVFEHRREANLGKIQNVRYVQPSFVAKQMNFGNVLLETAGETGKFTFDNVPRPKEVQSIIFNYLEAFRERTQRERRRSQDDTVLRWLSRYHRRVISGQTPAEPSE